MEHMIFNIEQLQTRLSNLPIGSDDANEIITYAKRCVNQTNYLREKLQIAVQMIGEATLEERLHEVGYYD